jgi:DNA (cytosine-5)-methyltransferase 1
MKYLSVCSGIEAATVAWHSLGWTPLAFSEIEKFPSQVLAHHYPNTPNLGDMTQFKEWNFESDVNVLVGGTPCQSFSVAGLRKGLDDPRGNLMLTYLAIAAKQRPKWVVWENVPGVLSSNGGLDFASFLRGLGQLGYGFAYRVLDAQYFGVAQRRRRVFVVGCAGDWRAAAAVLFERHSLQGHPAPSREKREGVAPSTRDGAEVGSLMPAMHSEISPALKARDAKGPSSDGDGDGDGDGAILVPMAYTLSGGSDRGLHVNKVQVATCLDTHNAVGEFKEQSQNAQTLVAQPIALDMAQITSKANGSRAEPGLPTGTLAKGSSMHVALAVYELHSQDSRVRELGDVCSTVSATYGAGGGNVPVTIQPIAFSRNDDGRDATHNLAPTMRVAGNAGGVLAAAFGFDAYNHTVQGQVNQPLRVSSAPGQVDAVGGIVQGMAVRRLSPKECERLQGFPDNYTDIQPKGKATPDGPRYKALGNSMAVPVMAWIGERIAQVEGIA